MRGQSDTAREPVSRREAIAALLGGGAGALLGRPDVAAAATPDTAADETITGEWTFANRTRIAEGERMSWGTGSKDGAKVNATGTGQGLEIDNSFILRKDSPEVIMYGKNGAWLGPAIDVAAAIACRDLVVAAKMNHPEDGQVNDFLYCSHNGEGDPTLGIGKHQPGSAYRTWIVGWTHSEDRKMGTLRLQAGRYQTGKVLTCTDWGGTDHVWVDPSDWSVVIEGEKLTREDLVALKELLNREEPPPSPEGPPPVVRGRRSKSALRHLLSKLDARGLIRDRTRP